MIKYSPAASPLPPKNFGILGDATLQPVGLEYIDGQAVQSVLKAAFCGDAEAAFVFGRLLVSGIISGRSFDVGLAWLQRASRLGNYEARLLVAEIEIASRSRQDE